MLINIPENNCRSLRKVNHLAILNFSQHNQEKYQLKVSISAKF